MTPETRFANRFCKAFEAAGWTTINMESLGDGVPDRLVFKYGAMLLIEAKIYPNALTTHQKVWIKKYFKNNCPLYIAKRKRQEIMLYRIHISESKEIIENYYQTFLNENGLIEYLENKRSY